MAINSKLAARLTSPLALLLFASLIAGGVALLAYHYLQKREATMRAELAASSKGRITPKVNVVVPNVNVEANTVLNGERFVSRPVDDDRVDPLLAAEVLVDDGLGDLGTRRDLLDARAVEPLRGKQSARDVEQLRSAPARGQPSALRAAHAEPLVEVAR